MPEYLAFDRKDEYGIHFVLASGRGRINFRKNDKLKIIWDVDSKEDKAGNITFYPETPSYYTSSLFLSSSDRRETLFLWEDALPLLEQTEWFKHFWPVEKCQAMIKLLDNI